MNQEMVNAAGAAAAKSAPPLAVVAASVGGAIDMTFLVGAATLIYLAAQIGYLVWKWRKEARAK